MDDVQERAFMKALGKEIKKWRELRGLTRDELAERTGISFTTVSRIERGDGTSPAGSNVVFRIALALDVPFADIVAAAERVLSVDARDRGQPVVVDPGQRPEDRD